MRISHTGAAIPAPSTWTHTPTAYIHTIHRPLGATALLCLMWNAKGGSLRGVVTGQKSKPLLFPQVFCWNANRNCQIIICLEYLNISASMDFLSFFFYSPFASLCNKGLSKAEEILKTALKRPALKEQRCNSRKSQKCVWTCVQALLQKHTFPPGHRAPGAQAMWRDQIMR